MADDQPQNPSGNSAEQPKKPFEPPRLHVYGDIAALTRAVGKTGLSDGGKGASNRTRP